MNARGAGPTATVAARGAGLPVPERTSPQARLRAKALACVAQREHSRVELRRKLLAYLDRLERAAAESRAAEVAPPSGAGSDEARDDMGDGAPDMPDTARVDAVLDWLAERDLISPERFVETRVQARQGRYGHRRIRQELSQHGVELDAAADQRLRDTELARAHALWSRRFEPPADAQARARQMRFLLARGFGADVAARVLRGDGAMEPDEG